MQAGGGEEQADAGQSGMDPVHERGLAACPQPGEQHDGASRGRQGRVLRAADSRQPGGGVNVTHHDGERLRRAALAVPQLGHGRRITRVAHQLVAAEPLQRDDPAPGDGLDRRTQRFLAAQFVPRQARTADGAGHGFGVEAPVAGVGVLGRAVGAEREAPHRRTDPVVRKVLDDGGARPAVGAVDERVAVAPVAGVAHLAQAGVADRRVRRDLARCRARVAGRAVPHAEALLERRLPCTTGQVDPAYPGENRNVGPQTRRELLDDVGRSRDLALHVPVHIGHPAVQAEGGRRAVHEGPEADSLDDPVHLEASYGHGSLRAGRPRWRAISSSTEPASGSTTAATAGESPVPREPSAPSTA